MPTEMTTVATSSDYHVLASDWLSFPNQNGFTLSQPTTGFAPHLWISGEVDVARTAVTDGSLGVVGVTIVSTLNETPWVSIDAGASLHVSASLPGGVAIGYINGSPPGPGTTLENHGEISVAADAAATGVINGAGYDDFANDGQLIVTSATSDATGVAFRSGFQHLTNFGEISVTGHGQVTGVDMGHGTNQSFDNLGTIIAQDDSSATTSIGVYWGGGSPGSTFVNWGRIEGDQALDVEISYGTAADNLVTNNATLAGAVWMGGGAGETLVNNGVITGAIRMIGAASLYDGRLGTALGPIVGSNNGGDTLLGGGGADTITGGLGNDVIDGGDGSNHLDGGAGLNTLSFASVSMGVQLDLAAGTAHVAGGDDMLTGFSQVTGSVWNDTLNAAEGSSVGGGVGDDVIVGAAGGSDYLRGDDGNDSILGRAGFDDINGNKGDDTIDGGSGGGDWLVGGQGNDFITAHDSDNILYGNLGNDTLIGGPGNDVIRGGQGDDSIVGGSGNNFISGDRGNDTESGGAGADRFHSSQEAGIDKVLDFHQAEGDRVMLDPGTTYTVSQVRADTIIDMGGGNQMILVGVQLSTLATGWIFEG
jgi:hypothetical protein